MDKIINYYLRRAMLKQALKGAFTSYKKDRPNDIKCRINNYEKR